MLGVPSDLHREILLRVPAESLFRCRAVCRAWCCIVDDPSFIKSHTLTHHSSNSSSSLLIRDCTCFRLYYLSLHSLTDAYHAHLTPIKNLVGRRGVRLLPHLPKMSCHGLILFNDSSMIWNPLTGDFLRLPIPQNTHYLEDGVGLGYDYAADDYKLVRVNNKYWEGEGEREFVYKTQVYSLKSRTWKVIKDCPQGTTMLESRFGVYLNGALHWMSRTAIMALELATEEYRLLPLPPPPAEPYEGLISHLDALDGCLFLTNSYLIKSEDEFFDLWVMKDGISPWIKLLSLVRVEEGSVDGLRGNGERFCFLRLIAYSKSRGEVIVKLDDSTPHFYSFDIQKNCKKEFPIHGLPECFDCQNFQGSLVDGSERRRGIKFKVGE